MTFCYFSFLAVDSKLQVLETIQRKFARNLARLRARADLTQAELAERAGLSVAQIAFMEQAKRWPRVETIELIMKALECDSRDLFLDSEGLGSIPPDVLDALEHLGDRPDFWDDVRLILRGHGLLGQLGKSRKPAS